MSQLHKHAIPSAIAERALINPAQYQQYYQQSVQDLFPHLLRPGGLPQGIPEDQDAHLVEL